MAAKCDACGVKDRDVFKCDGCGGSRCKTCGLLTSSEVKVLQLSSRVMRFYCKDCDKKDIIRILNDLVKAREELSRGKDEIIKSKEVIVADKEEIICMLRSENELVKNQSERPQQMKTLSYSEMLKRKPTEILIVKPKNATQSSADTRKIMEEKINPSALGVGVNQVKYVREGGVAIKCSRTEDIENMSESIKRNMGEEYNVSVPAKKNPKIKIFNVDKKLLEDHDDIIDKLVMQNSIDVTSENHFMKIMSCYTDRNGRSNVVLEMDPDAYRQVCLRDVLHIGWRSCRYVNHIGIIQCYNCWRYGHMAKECKEKKPTCPKCCGEHKSEVCQAAENVCTNCRHASQVLKIPGVNYNHSAFDRRCSAYRRVYDQMEQKVNYPHQFSRGSQ